MFRQVLAIMAELAYSVEQDVTNERVRTVIFLRSQRGFHLGF